MAILEEKVLSIHHWTDKTFSFKTTRNKGFRFNNPHLYRAVTFRANMKTIVNIYVSRNA